MEIKTEASRKQGNKILHYYSCELSLVLYTFWASIFFSLFLSLETLKLSAIGKWKQTLTSGLHEKQLSYSFLIKQECFSLGSIWSC